ncbi:protein FAM200A-like [Tachypleus tridentatus]|uniref:protein FAM200A-like n=1 Tax=Tachypleus tridentatus TaxID=6853 RepID=UPI003FCEE954
MKEKEFELQLDEATDNNKDAHLICYIRFVDDDKIAKDLLICKSITANTKTQVLLLILDTFMCENNLDWTKCFGVCINGGSSMSGCYGGLQALKRSKALEALWIHCIIHREALASKYLSPSLNLILESVLKVVNLIKIRPQKQPDNLQGVCQIVVTENYIFSK